MEVTGERVSSESLHHNRRPHITDSSSEFNGMQAVLAIFRVLVRMLKRNTLVFRVAPSCIRKGHWLNYLPRRKSSVCGKASLNS